MSFIGPESRKQLRLVARALSAGFELVAAILTGYGGGWALDWWLGTAYCRYVGLILGVVAGFRNLFLFARAASAATQQTVDFPSTLPSTPSSTQPSKSSDSDNRADKT